MLRHAGVAEFFRAVPIRSCPATGKAVRPDVRGQPMAASSIYSGRQSQPLFVALVILSERLYNATGERIGPQIDVNGNRERIKAKL
jgi:hypothetical protein